MDLDIEKVIIEEHPNSNNIEKIELKEENLHKTDCNQILKITENKDLNDEKEEIQKENNIIHINDLINSNINEEKIEKIEKFDLNNQIINSEIEINKINNVIENNLNNELEEFNENIQETKVFMNKNDQQESHYDEFQFNEFLEEDQTKNSELIDKDEPILEINSNITNKNIDLETKILSDQVNVNVDKYDEFEFEEFDEKPLESNKLENIKKNELVLIKNDKNQFEEENNEFEEFDEKPVTSNIKLNNEVDSPELKKINEDLEIKYKKNFNINEEFFKENENHSNVNNKVKNDKQYRSNNITDYYLDLEQNNYSISNFIQNIKSYKSDKEILFRNIEMNEFSKYNNLNEKELKKKYQNHHFYSDLSKVPKTVIKKLYFKMIDSKNIYDNMFSIKTNSIKKTNSDNNLFNLNYNSHENNDTEFDFEGNAEKNSEFNITNYIINDKDKKLSDFEFNNDDEFVDHTSYKNNNLYEKKNSDNNDINNVIFSLVIDNKTIEMPKVLNNLNETDKKILKSQDDNIPAIKYDENNMLEMLKNYGIKLNDNENINNPVNSSIVSKDRINIFINKLPNYHFLVSKSVEYPDSFFNF